MSTNNSTPQKKKADVDYFAPNAPAVFPDATDGGCASASGAISSAQENIGKYLSKNNEQLAKIQKNFPNCTKSSSAAAVISLWGAGAAKTSKSSGCQSVSVQANLNVNMNASLNCTCNTIQNNITNNSKSELGLILDLNIDKAGKINITGNQKNTQETKVINFTSQQVKSSLVSSTKTAFNNFQKQVQKSTKPKDGFFTSQQAAAQQSLQSQANAIMNSSSNINMSNLITNIISNTVTATNTKISLNVGVVKDLNINLNQENFNTSVVENISSQVMSSVLKNANIADITNKAESDQSSEVKAEKANKIGIFLTLFFITLGCYFAYAPCLPMLQQVMTPQRRKIAFYTGLVLWAILCLMTYFTRKLSVHKIIRVVLTIILSIFTLIILVFRFLGPYTYFGVSMGGGFDSCQGPQQQQQQQPQPSEQDVNKSTDNQQQVATSTQQKQSAGKKNQSTQQQTQQQKKLQQQKNKKQNSNQQNSNQQKNKKQNSKQQNSSQQKSNQQNSNQQNSNQKKANQQQNKKTQQQKNNQQQTKNTKKQQQSSSTTQQLKSDPEDSSPTGNIQQKGAK